ncbi:MAG: NAD(P)-dependent oxidoreductase [Lentisphaerae bacterium]|jgi:UDP-glucose 4-epimerase|nr:NAD(P)-dependent oxidoreductase [Lentisphaerota bacterium]MBT4817623.1 NAD(P)-dependent oxidoreductase [Lentisphaerota bacterium]MBT5605367.1 NAD(P)-dependent oxidoreductase [Lentisphaerota bacterium]MBT7060372.1 NAD(P)-dependent oxidoreductase [Lentisphaerota bacterium]MBT7844774.1 NAD(P)-dependent oxidoreductase [Lentisphaerota bacterium]
MNVLITGAAGVLGKAVTGLLADEPGIQLRLTDVVDFHSPHEVVRADLANPEDVDGLCDDIDEVLHIASIHPWKEYTPAQYIDCNIKGTFNLLEAAAQGPVKRVIYTSSIAAMGMAPKADCPPPWDEAKPCTPYGHLYCVTKHVGEQCCHLFHQKGAFSYVFLRPGTFIPRADDDPSFGLGLLSSWVHASDVAQAHLLAFRSDVENEAFVITAKVPFTQADSVQLLSDAPTLILRHFPRAAKLKAKGIELPATLPRCYDVGKAERLLGYSPRVTFGTWLDSFLDGQV